VEVAVMIGTSMIGRAEPGHVTVGPDEQGAELGMGAAARVDEVDAVGPRGGRGVEDASLGEVEQHRAAGVEQCG
jgi:hypothetical protein